MQANLTTSRTEINDGLDAIVFQQALGGVPGGRTLDTSGITETAVKAGHIIIVETATGNHKPLAITGGAYATLPAGHSYVGVLRYSVPKSDPRAAIVTIGQVNTKACPAPVTEAIKSGLPQIKFV